jgi:hypothetical protein
MCKGFHFGCRCRPRTRAAEVLEAILVGMLVGVCDVAQAEHTVQLDTGILQAVVADNEPYGTEHQPGYSGVSELRLKSGDQRNLFVPLYAGLNFEHVFSGDSTSYGWHIFEPRRAPRQLIRASSIHSVLSNAA